MRSTMPDFPLTLQHFLWRSTTLFPRKEIVTRTADGVIRYDYRAFGGRVAQLAHALRELGVRSGDRVGTLAWNNARHFELYFAVPCSGAVLHTLNPRLFPEHLEFVINDAEDRVIFVDSSLLPVLERISGKLKGVTQFVLMGEAAGLPSGKLGSILSYEELIEGRPTAFDWPLIDERDASAMCYTSGTTGKPKGVVYSHRSAVLHSFGIAVGGGLGISEPSVALPVVPMFHANAWGMPYAAAMVGAKLVFPDRFLDPVSLVDLFTGEKVTLTAGVPSVWIALLQHLDKTGLDLPGLMLFNGGSALPAGLYDGLTRHGIKVDHGWGMTETSPVAATAALKSHLPASDERRIKLKQGLPLAGVEIRLMDVEEKRLVAWDGKSVGEVQVRGPWITSGYYRGVDQDRFTEDGWLRTGDVANLDPEGYIQIVDRVKDLVKSGGEWISSVELESALMGHPGVLEAAVIGVPHPKWQERPVAYVVPKPDLKGRLTQEELLEFLRPQVARWWLPDEIRFIDEIPKTSVGKFDKKAIRERALRTTATGLPSE